MKTESVRDILHRTRKLHHIISDYYKELGSKADKERLKLLLNYLSIHEQHLEETFSEYEDIANLTILDSWILNSSCAEKISEIKKSLERKNITVDEIISMAIEVDNCIIKMYKSLRDNSDNEQIRNVFDNILAMEQKQERLAIRDMGMINEF